MKCVFCSLHAIAECGADWSDIADLDDSRQDFFQQVGHSGARMDVACVLNARVLGRSGGVPQEYFVIYPVRDQF